MMEHKRVARVRPLGAASFPLRYVYRQRRMRVPEKMRRGELLLKGLTPSQALRWLPSAYLSARRPGRGRGALERNWDQFPAPHGIGRWPYQIGVQSNNAIPAMR